MGSALHSILPSAPAAPFSDQLSKEEIREQRIRDCVKGVFSFSIALVLGHLAQHALREVKEFSSFQSCCINLYAGVFFSLYGVAASSIAYQSYLKVTAPDPILKPKTA